MWKSLIINDEIQVFCFLKGSKKMSVCVYNRFSTQKQADAQIDVTTKRVATLYRVSTKKQVSEQEDIPMQKQACTDFADRQGWVVVKEFLEKGISGFKVSADDRDILQDLMESALRKEFDILLVFMFDRLGRRDDETPFVVEWFVKQGIEIFYRFIGKID